MSKLLEKIGLLPDLLPLKAATVEEVSNAEKTLNLSFSKEYKEYLLEYGAILADGIELTGIAKSSHRNVVNVTQQEIGLNPLVPSNFYVVENTGVDGIIIWQEENGNIHQSSPNKNPTKVADSLLLYIESR